MNRETSISSLLYCLLFITSCLQLLGSSDKKEEIFSVVNRDIYFFIRKKCTFPFCLFANKCLCHLESLFYKLSNQSTPLKQFNFFVHMFHCMTVLDHMRFTHIPICFPSKGSLIILLMQLIAQAIQYNIRLHQTI